MLQARATGRSSSDAGLYHRVSYSEIRNASRRTPRPNRARRAATVEFRTVDRSRVLRMRFQARSGSADAYPGPRAPDVMLYFHGFGHFHPENQIDNAFLEELDIGTNDAWIVERVGIKNRRTVLP